MLENIGNDGIHRIIVTEKMLENGDFSSICLSVQKNIPGGGERIPVVYRGEDIFFFSPLHILVPKDFPGVRIVIVFCFWRKITIFEYAVWFPDSPSPKRLALEPFRRIEADLSLTIPEMDRLIQAPEPESLWEGYMGGLGGAFSKTKEEKGQAGRRRAWRSDGTSAPDRG